MFDRPPLPSERLGRGEFMWLIRMIGDDVSGWLFLNLLHVLPSSSTVA